jgi:hypothetical protein
MHWTALALTFTAVFAAVVGAIQLPAGYDTVWNSQSQNSSGSMPLGGGGVGLNVWVESGQLAHAGFMSHIPCRTVLF